MITEYGLFIYFDSGLEKRPVLEMIIHYILFLLLECEYSGQEEHLPYLSGSDTVKTLASDECMR